MKVGIFWAITGELGLYAGTWFLRKEAIESHVDALGASWKTCYKRGDRAIKVKVIPCNEYPKQKGSE